MEKTDIDRLEKKKLPARNDNQDVGAASRPQLLRSNTVLGGNIKINKTGTRGYLCRWRQCEGQRAISIINISNLRGPVIKLSTRR